MRREPVARAIDPEPRGVTYELFILLVSLLSIANVVAIVVTGLGPSGPAQEVIVTMEAILTPIFFADVVHRLRSTSSPYRYLMRDYGWADALAILPLLRVFRVFRVGRTVATLRAMGRPRVLAELAASRALATFLFTVFLVLLVVEVASATIYYAEKGAAGANIETAGDAIWWALVTITTVGYGDYYPVTQLGRFIGVFLLFAGIALFSVLTGFIANVFLAPRARLRAARGTGDVRATIVATRGLLEEQEASTDAIRQRLDELERLLDRHDGDRAGSDGEPSQGA